MKRVVAEPLGMTPSGDAARPDETKQFLVSCEDCPFERTVGGSVDASRIGGSHRRQTDHDVVAVELPRQAGGSEGDD
jgi:hypothetical protein